MCPGYNNSTDEINKAAMLFCEGMNEKDIASILACNMDDVKSMLDKALHEKYFRYEPILSIDDFTKDMSDFLYNETLSKDISEVLRESIELCHIPVTVSMSPLDMFSKYQCSSPENEDNRKKYVRAETESLYIVGRRAAQELSQKLFDGQDHVIGVNYGVSVYSTVRFIAPLPSQVTNKLTIVSLFGDLDFHTQLEEDFPFIHKDKKLACNDIVAQFANRLGPNATAELLNAPVYIPQPFKADSTTFEDIHSFLTNHASYGRIFTASGQQSGVPLISSIDTLISGFGSADNYTVLQRFLGNWLDKEEFAKVMQYCENGDIVGDLGGHFITAHGKTNLSGDLPDFLESVNRRLVATKPKHFTEVAERHLQNKDKGAGVVGIAAGGRKARVLNALLAQRPCPISSLFIDSHCALALLKLIDKKRFDDLVKKNQGSIAFDSNTWSDGTKRLFS